MSKVSASDFGYGGVNGHLSNFKKYLVFYIKLDY